MLTPCPRCGTPNSPTDAACGRCGRVLKPGAKPAPGSSRGGPSSGPPAGAASRPEFDEQQLKNIKWARATILTVGILNLVLSAGVWFIGSFIESAFKEANALTPEQIAQLEKLLAEAAAEDGRLEGPDMDGDEAAELKKLLADPEAQARMGRELARGIHFMAAIGLAVGAIFVGLFLWAKTNPFGATLTALTIYGLGVLGDVLVTEEGLPSGFFLKVMISLILLKGVMAGWAYRKAKAGTEEPAYLG